MPNRSLPLVFAALAAACGGSSSSSESGAALSANATCAGGQTVAGIDVSHYQGSIDWASVKAAGKDFAIARVSDGLDYPDTDFDTNWSAMKSAGLVRAVYQYFEPAQDPVAQANLLLQHTGALGAGDLPAVIDVETMGGLSAAQVNAAVASWISAVQQGTGKRPLVYTSPSFWSGLGDPSVNADLWIANWGVSCPAVPAAWSGWVFWQESDTGSVSGISGAVDTDEFNGSLAQLLAYAGSSTPPPPPQAPTVQISEPANGATVSGTVSITVSASASATRVELYLDGALLVSSPSSGLSDSWDSTQVADGPHSLSARAYDAAGDEGDSAAVSIAVSNATTTPPPPPPVTCPPGTTDVGGTCVTSTGCSSTGGTSGGLAALLACAALAFSRRRR